MKFSGGLGGTMPKIGATSIAKPATSTLGGFGAKPGATAGAAASGGTTPAPAAYKPPANTKEIATFKPPELEIVSNGTKRKMKIQNIAADPKFKAQSYTPEELRFFDYINQEKIAAPPTQSITGLKGSINIQQSKPQGEKSAPISLSQSKTATEQQQPKIEYKNIQFTEPKPAEIPTAAEFFKTKKLERKLQESTQDLVFLGKPTKNYSLYFTQKSNAFSGNNSYTYNAIKPVRFTSDMLHSITPVRLSENELLNTASFHKIKTIPPLSEINRLQAKDLEIIREGVAEVKFQQVVDASNFDIDTDVVIEPCFLNFFPQYTTKKQKQEKAKGMDVQATITMYGVWPAAKSSEIRKRISSTDSPEAHRFHQALMLFCHSKNSRFKSYDCLRGVFTFEVDGICDGPYDIPIGN